MKLIMFMLGLFFVCGSIVGYVVSNLISAGVEWYLALLPGVGSLIFAIMIGFAFFNTANISITKKEGIEF